jgi:FAD/FMN-containing dehydrogenase
MGGQLSYPLARAQEVVAAYDAWSKDLPEAMAAYGYVGHDPDPADPTRKIPTFRITPVYNGDYAEGVSLVQPMLKLNPFNASFYSMPLPTWESTIGRSTLVGDRQAYIRSGMIGDGGWHPGMIAALTHAMETAPSPDSFVVWTHGRGKVNHPDGENHGPFPHRDKRYIFELKTIWDDPAAMRANVEWAYDFGEALSADFYGAYVNYIDPLQKDWAHAYYGDNLARLQAIKAAADPHGFFAFQQSVDSKFEPDLSRPLDLSPLNRTIV